MTEMSPEERRLFDKYGMGRPPMDPALNTVVQSMLDSEALLAASGLPDTTALFALCPALANRAEQAADSLRMEMHYGLVQFEVPGEDKPYDPDDPTDIAVLVNLVGTQNVFVVRHRRHDIRLGTPARYYGDLLALWDEFPAFNLTHQCMNLADNCMQTPTTLLPCNRGHLVLVFEICEVCLAVAGHQAEVNHRIGVLEARAKVDLLAAEPDADEPPPDADKPDAPFA